MIAALAQARRTVVVAPDAAVAVRLLRQAGFTLVELLVVLVIIGCLVSLALFSTGRNTERELQEEAQRLATVMTLLADEAVLENREYGLLISTTGYQVLNFADDCGCWSASRDQQGYSLPSWARMQLQLDGEPLQLGGTATADEAADSAEESASAQVAQPQLLLLSSGELSAFRLRLEVRDLSDQAFAVSSDGFQLPAVSRVHD